MFPQKILQVPTLSFIDISENYNLHGIFPEFPLNASLHTLLVSNTKFSGPVPISIGNLRHLSTLDLFESEFNGTLPNSLSNLTQLVELTLSRNRFSGPIPNLGMCKRLQHLDLSGNNLSGTIPSTHYEGLANLVDIDLGGNFFTGKIPSSLFMLPSLQSVALSSNKFDGQLDDFINVTSRVQWLDLSWNQLEGPIPTSLFQLRDLQQLFLSSNKLNGTLELNMIGNLGNLVELDLSYNNLSVIDIKTALYSKLTLLNLAFCKLTAVPNFLKNQSELVDVDLSNNHIAGTIPHWISNLYSLNSLNLSYNYFTDWEEPLLSNMSVMTILDLHSNHIQGPIPALPPSLLFLDYSSNKLHGNIPESTCNASYLQVLDLSNNALTSTIPRCLIAMNGTLTILDLGRNKLNGTIDTFPGSCDLRTLHLNGNSLKGKIPKYLLQCAMLEILDLGDNQIEDQFPCWLKNISTLRVLILRSNKLHGSLQCLGTQVTWPHLQIIDLASNNFSGRIPLSLFETWKAMMTDENDGIMSKLKVLRFETARPIYYPDKVTVTSKQLRMDLRKILTIFTAIDLSCNKFEGVIPEGLGQLKALYILNLSCNAFSGIIPSSMGNMKELESLDLSSNNLSGEIPAQLASLSFLSYLNLSYNHLGGKIPTGTQIQSFEAASFKGNDGLCGPPLTLHCSGDAVQGASSPPESEASHADTDGSIDWNFISAELGFSFGIGIILLPLVFYKPWRLWYSEHVDNVLYRIFPQVDFVYESRGGQRYTTLRWISH